MKLLLIALLLTFSNATNYWDMTDDKPYFKQRDNKAHIAIYSVIGGLASYTAREEFGWSKTHSWLLGVAVSTAAGVFKESHDHKFDNSDLSSCILGGVVGSSLIVYTF